MELSNHPVKMQNIKKYDYTLLEVKSVPAAPRLTPAEQKELETMLEDYLLAHGFHSINVVFTKR
jgi:hypothetical protein